MNERKKVIAFIGNYKYSGYLELEDDTTYTIDDIKEGIIKLPKNNTILKVLSDE